MVRYLMEFRSAVGYCRAARNLYRRIMRKIRWAADDGDTEYKLPLIWFAGFTDDQIEYALDRVRRHGFCVETIRHENQCLHVVEKFICISWRAN